MRRVSVYLMSFAALTVLASPALAEDRWAVQASAGPSFGTFGSTAVVGASMGYEVNDRVALAGEVGMLPHVPFDKASMVAPAVPTIANRERLHVNGYHANANLMVKPAEIGRFGPYVTAGVGAFIGTTVASGRVDDVSLSSYRSATNPAMNLGGGVSLRVTERMGVTTDYRHFLVDAGSMRHVNRFTTGVTFSIK